MTHRIGGVDQEGARQIGLVVELDPPLDRFTQPGFGHHRQGDTEVSGGLLLRVPGPGPTRTPVREVLALGQCADDHLGEGHAGERGQRRAHLIAVLHGLVHARGLVMDLGGVHPAADAVESAGERLDHGLDAARHHDVAVARAMPARIDDRRARSTELMGDAFDDLGVDAGDVGGPFGGVGFEFLELSLEHRHHRPSVEAVILGRLERRGEGIAVDIDGIVVAEGGDRAHLVTALDPHPGPPLLVGQQSQLAGLVAIGEERHVAVLAQERGIVQSLVHQDAHHGQQERQVGAGPDLDPFIRLGRRLRAARIERDDLRALLAPLGETHHATGRDRADGGIVAHEEDVLGIVEVRQHLVVDVEVAGDEIRAQMAGRDAVLHRRSNDVGHLVGHGEGHRPAHVEHARGPAADHGPLPGLDRGGLGLLGDVVVSLFPARGAEGVFAALGTLDADQRRLEPVGVVSLAQPRLAAGADLAAIER